MKLPSMVNVKEFFSIEKMKNKNLLIFLFSVVLCTTIVVLAKEDQNETKVSNKKLQHSSVESSQNDLPKVLQVLQFRTTVTDQVTEKISESVIETLPATTDINNETTQDHSVITEAMEDINQNVTTKASILPKRQVITPIPEEIFATDSTLEQSYSAPMTLEQLENYSCMEEASTFGHKEAAGVLIHEVICELRKLWHYILIAGENLKTEFQMELPIETEEAIILLSDLIMNGAIFDTLEQGIVHLEVFLENPDNLNGFLDTIEKCLPMSHINETVGRLRIAFSNFFIHLQGFVIYLEPHQSIRNYIELFQGFEEKICAAIEKILDFFDVHLKTEMKFVSEFISSVKLWLKFSFEKPFEENLKILKELVDNLSKTYKEPHASESSESIIEKVHTVIPTFISTFLPHNFDIPIVHFVLSNKSVATLSCIWQVTNETSSDSVAISSHHNVTSISKIDTISSILEIEAKFFSELFSCVKLLLEKLCPEQTFEQHLKLLKECIDKLAKICKEYYEMDCSKSIIGEEQSLFSSFVSTLFTQDFEFPVLHFNSSDGSPAVLKCTWKVTNETSSISPLFLSKFNLTSIVEDEKIDQTKSLPENIVPATASSKSSVSIQNADNSAPIPTNNPSESPLVVGIISENVSSLSQESASSPIEHKPSQYKTTGSPQEDSTKYIIQSSSSSSSSSSLTVNNKVPSSLPKVQVNSADTNPQKDSLQPGSSVKAPIVSDIVTLDSSPPSGRNIQNEQQLPDSPSLPEKPDDSLVNSPPIPPLSPEKPDDSLINSPLIPPLSPEKLDDSLINSPPIPPSFPENSSDSLANNSSIPSPFTEKPADFLDFVPSTSLPSSEKPDDVSISSPSLPPSLPVKPDNLLANNPPISSSSLEKTADLVSSNNRLPPPSPAKPADLLINNSPLLPSSSVKPVEFLNISPSISLSSFVNPDDLPSTSLPIPPSSPVNPVDLPSVSPPIPPSSVINPSDLSSINPPVTSFPLEKPSDLSGNNSPIASLPFEEPSDLSNNHPPIFSSPTKPAELSTNGSPIPSFPLGEPTNLSDDSPILSAPVKPAKFSSNSPPIPSLAPGEPAEFPSNNPSIPPYPFKRPAELSSNSRPVLPYAFGSPADFLENNQPILSYPFERPVDLSTNNPPTFLPSPGRPTDFSFNNPLVPSYYPGKPLGYSNNPSANLPSPGKSSPTVLFLGKHEPAVEKNYNELFSPLIPPGYLIPASDIIPNLPRYQPLSNSYDNYLESADAFYKSLYSYLQYGNPAVEPPPNVSNKISEFLRRGFPPSLPITMDNSNICGTSAVLSSVSTLNNILKNNIRSSRFSLYVSREEIASALGNTILSSGDLIIILPKNGIGLIGKVIDGVSPILFKMYVVRNAFTVPQDGIKIWHLRSEDFHNPECEQQIELLFKH